MFGLSAFICVHLRPISRLRYPGPVRHLRLLALIFVTGILLCQTPADPWSKSEFVEPEVIAKLLQSSATPPKIICVAFPLNFKRHLPKAVYAGPGSKAEGIELLKKAVADVPKDAAILLYCGCCPMNVCPNLRPAFKVLKELGYTRVRAMNIPTNMPTDWYGKNYPTEESTPAK